MLDNSIDGHSQFAEGAAVGSQIEWGGSVHSSQIAGFVRKKVHPDSDYQAQVDALFTIGRLIREGHIQAFTYSELMFEGWSRVIGERAFDALADCPVKHCDSPIERSRFFQTSQFSDYIAKGGKKDRKVGKDTSMSRIRFVEWLLDLTDEHVTRLISLRKVLKLSDFEIESFQNLQWFRVMCRTGQSPENYPDMLHLWAAQRNRMDVFLTLERRLPNIASHFPIDEACSPSFPTQVLRPLELLSLFRISTCDPVPIEPNRFYPIFGESFPIDDENS
jgi:hypothetical protein